MKVLFQVISKAFFLILLPLVLWHVPAIQALWTKALHGHGVVWAPFWFLCIGMVYCSLGLPKQVLCLAASVGFGLGQGGIIALAACVGGAVMSYGYGYGLDAGRRAFRTGIRQAVFQNGQMLKKLRASIHQVPFRTVLALRLMPVGSALLVSLGAGIWRVPLGAFVAATCLGSMPQVIVFVLAGAGGHMGHYAEIMLAVVLFLFSTLLGVNVWQRCQAL